MRKSEKLLEAMRENPRNNWTIDHIKAVCRVHEIEVKPPSHGSHYKLSHSSQESILTVPYNRPIKAVYIKKLVAFVDRVRSS